ncbi:MAG: protocatechuate 3,4-dioxygenase [Chloroflexi bacterium]|nr:protocatechuate 3,4-dioxygenase [Chloroflexota bacterium]
MAEVALAIGSSHMPGLNNPVEHWFTRAEADRNHLQTTGLADYDKLSRDRASWIAPELTEDRIREKYAACQRALRVLADELAAVKPDVIVIVGDDHREVFSADHMPSFDVHWAEEIYAPPFVGRRPGTFGAETQPAIETGQHMYPGDVSLAQHVLESLIADEFDVAHSRTLGPEGLGHAFDFVCRRIMEGQRIPLVPLLLNTYYPPNRPTASRCYALGQALRSAIDSWPSEKRVAIVGTGGLTHHVVDAEMDRAVLSAIERHDEATLTGFPEACFVDGTSEIKAWVVVAGAMADDTRPMRLVEYQPCYRSPAGTGCGNAFAYWE